MNASQILCVSLAAWLPSCLIYDESLLSDDSSAADAGTDSDSDGADLSASGGGINGTGGVAPSGGAPGSGGVGTGGSATGGAAADCADYEIPAGYGAGAGVTRTLEDFNINTRVVLAGDDAAFTGNWNAVGDLTAGASGLSPTVGAWAYAQDPCLAEDNLSLNIQGTGYTGWGASFDAELKVDTAPFDASAYQGVVYWARTASASQSIKVAFFDGATHNLAVRALTQDWKPYLAPFPVDLDKTSLKLVQFVAVGQAEFDLWIDDVAFYVGE